MQPQEHAAPACAEPGDSAPPINKPLISSICARCKERKSMSVFRGSSICWPCMEERVRHAFRVDVSKVRESSVKNQRHHLLLCFSGGIASRAMLHLMHECLGENQTGKKMFFDVTVLHIDESAVMPQSSSATQMHALQTKVEKYGFPFVIVPLENLYLRASTTRPEAAKELQAALADATSITAKEDFVSHLRYQLILATARKMSISKIIIGETASRLAVNAFSSVAKGKGGNLPSDMELCDKRHEDILICRPLRDLLLKELAIYIRYKQLETIDIPNLSTMLPAKSSLNQMAEQFIFGLQEEFPHTVHTVLRSVDKLKSTATPVSILCPICSGRLSKEEIEAITTASSTPPKSSCSSCDCGSNASCTTLPVDQFVCYACKKLLQEGLGAKLPALLHEKVEAVVATARSEKLRAKIQEFLLTDEDEDQEMEGHKDT